MIERYDTDRAFNRERYTIHGTSRTRLLAAPYAPLRSKSSTTNINAKQAATEELTNTGFYPQLVNHRKLHHSGLDHPRQHLQLPEPDRHAGHRQNRHHSWSRHHPR